MKLGFCSLASGSSGNCYLIKSDNTNLLLDAGISCKAIQAGLESLGISLKDIDGIFITHDHIDHIKGIKTLLKADPQGLQPGLNGLAADARVQQQVGVIRFYEIAVT